MAQGRGDNGPAFTRQVCLSAACVELYFVDIGNSRRKIPFGINIYLTLMYAF